MEDISRLISRLDSAYELAKELRNRQDVIEDPKGWHLAEDIRSILSWVIDDLEEVEERLGRPA